MHEPDPLDRRPGPGGIWQQWSRLRILALAVLLLAGNFMVQLMVYAAEGGLSWPVLAGAVVGVGGPLLVLTRAGALVPRDDLGWRWPGWRAMLLTAGVALATVPPTSLLASLSMRMHPPDPEWIRLLNEHLPRTPSEIALAAVAVVLAAPLAEEIVFRALVHRLAASMWGALPGACVSALVFAIAHAEPWFLFGLVGIGLMLALVWEATGSLQACWLAHALHNALSLGLMVSAREVGTGDGTLATGDLLLAGGGLLMALLLGRELLRLRS